MREMKEHDSLAKLEHVLMNTMHTVAKPTYWSSVLVPGGVSPPIPLAKDLCVASLKDRQVRRSKRR